VSVRGAICATAIASLALAAGCSGKVAPAGGLFLLMCTDGTLRPDSLQLVVRSPDGSKKYRERTYALGTSDLESLPASLAIESNRNAAASVAIDVGIWAGGVELDVRHYEVRQIPTDRVTQLDVVFSASCVPAKCAALKEWDADKLPAYTGTSSECRPPSPEVDAGASDAADARDTGNHRDVSVSDSGVPDAVAADAGSDAAVDVQVMSDGGAPCMPLAHRCVGNTPQVCHDGQWENAPSCFPGMTHCSSGECLPVPPSCAAAPPGAGFDCSSAGNGDCCASYDVAGGTFFRDNDYQNPDRTYPATVSSFRLDAYEITVGRFRQFVRAVVAGWRPDAGAGKHAHVRQGSGLVDVGDGGTATFETGWDASWTANLPVTAIEWDTRLSCSDTATWTPNQGLANERFPLTCVDWYAAYAFCIWDGGFLPSSAEWNYAAAGGAEQRLFAWGDQTPDEDTALAIWGCHYGGPYCTGLANVAPVGSARGGDGRWGQSDLTGSVWEWVLDFEAPFVLPCVDCAPMAGMGHVVRGGAFNNYVADLAVSHHLWSRGVAKNLGARCARVIP
jgi:formylglycine-generating enzyme required for sulfatase activity